MARKGQGLSINVIVIAAIALLVLVILSVLVIRAGRTIDKSNECEQTGGICRNPDTTLSGGRCEDGETPDTSKVCPGSTQDSPRYCCRKV
jgi:hypothetical protein